MPFKADIFTLIVKLNTHICTTNKTNYFQNPKILLLDIIIGSDKLNSKEAIQSRYIHLDSEAKHTHVQHIKVTMPVTKMSFSFHLPPPGLSGSLLLLLVDRKTSLSVFQNPQFLFFILGPPPGDTDARSSKQDDLRINLNY